MNDYYDYLAHYGVLGMKWGVRRYQNPDGTLTAEGRARYSGEKSDSSSKRTDAMIKKERREDSKNRRTLSDEELNKIINRLARERKLKELTDADVSIGKAEVEKLLYSSAKQVLGSTITGVGLFAAKKIVEATLGKNAASFVKSKR